MKNPWDRAHQYCYFYNKKTPNTILVARGGSYVAMDVTAEIDWRAQRGQISFSRQLRHKDYLGFRIYWSLK